MKIYIYGIIDFQGITDYLLKGLEERLVYTIPYRDIGAAVSDLHLYPRTKNLAMMVDHILDHERVVERLSEKFTVLPVKFLTTFNTKEDVLSMMKGYYRDFKRNLDRLREKVEFGLKVIWRGEDIKQCITNAHHANGKVPVPDNSPLKNFMMKKYKQYKIQKEFEEKAESSIAVIDNIFSPFACEKRLEGLKTGNLLLNAYYLIEKENQVDFKGAFEKLRKTFSHFQYLLSGPWPPYNFILLTKKIDFLKGFGRVPMLYNLLQQQNFSSGLNLNKKNSPLKGYFS